MVQMSFLGRCFAAKGNLNSSCGITLRLETDAYQRQELLLFLRANVAADDFESSRTHLIAFAEFIKKSFPLIAFDKTWHDVFSSLICSNYIRRLQETGAGAAGRSRKKDTCSCFSYCPCLLLLFLLLPLPTAPAYCSCLLLLVLGLRSKFAKRRPHLLLPAIALNRQRHFRARWRARYLIAENVGVDYFSAIESCDDVALLEARSL